MPPTTVTGADYLPVAADEHHVYIGMGSNLGDRDSHLRAALAALGAFIQITAFSSVYDTAPQLVEDQPRFYNAVCAGSTSLDPLPLLHALKSIEVALGRAASRRYGPRLIDLDLLLYDDCILNEPELTVPHPRIAERAFVLLPLAEIAPQLRHPTLHQTIAELAEAVASADVQRVGPLSPNVS